MSNIKTIKKKRLTIMIEVPYLKRVLRKLEEIKVPGYTVVTAIAGAGRSTNWRADALSSDTGQMAQILMYLDEGEIEPILEPMYKSFKHQIGIVSICDEEILDKDCFS